MNTVVKAKKAVLVHAVFQGPQLVAQVGHSTPSGMSEITSETMDHQE